MLKDHNISFAMSCPSAKAAKVLQKYSGFEATTIHRMLGYDNGQFTYCANHPLPYQMVIIDECSMLDVWLMKSVLEAIDFRRTKLLLVGDSYQLPSVGAGNLFHDLIQSNVCPISTLDEIFRYSEGGLITVATDTRNGKKFLPDKIPIGQSVVPFGNSYFFCPQSKENCVNYVVKMYQKLAETNDLEDIMVITAQNKGEYGAIVLNNKIQEAINPNTQEVITYTTSEDVVIEYRYNDIVMQTVNDYHSIVCDEHGYYEVDEKGEPLYETLIANGENGRIVYITKHGMVVKYDNCYIWRTKSDLEKMMLGYAMTCHKSQGSGCKNVIVLTPSAHIYMLNSNLLYVALTRAKQKCFHVGSLYTIHSAIKKKQNLSRKTFLQEIIKKEKEIYNDTN
jgi:exodeoxyribonuclease V alpha subunit